LIHCDFNSNNAYFDVHHHIQTADFRSIGLDVRESKMGGFSGSGWTAQTDVRGFALILLEIVTRRSAKSERSLPPNIPVFVSRIITTGLWSEFNIQDSFCNIFDILKQNNFEIIVDVDRAEVLAFVNWVESAEYQDQ
jgi:hypothetical protein